MHGRWALSPRLVAAVTMGLVLFVVDLLVPLGVAAGVPYLAVLLVAWNEPRQAHLIGLAALTSALVAVGHLVSPAGGVAIDLTNRGLGLLVIWTVFGLIVLARRDEQRLRDSEGRLLSIASNLPGIVYRRLGHEDGRYSYPFVSKPTTPEMNWFDGEPVSVVSGFAPLVHPEDRCRREQALQVSARDLSHYDLTFRIVVPGDGDVRWLRSVARPQRGDDGLVIWDGIVLDITEQYRAEIAIRKSEARLRHAQNVEAVGRLTGGIAHDFNNALHVIRANLELIEGDVESTGPGGDRLRRAERAADQAAALTERLLTYSRDQVLNPTLTDLNALIVRMADLLRSRLGDTVAVRTEPASDTHLAHVDRGQLEAALVNLAVNARDSMPSGGLITIATGNAEVDAEEARRLRGIRPGSYVTLQVRDQGVGMAPELVQRAFEPFFTSDDMGRGRGLSLSMVYGFIIQSGGEVDIDSRVGHGTAVSLYLPRSTARVANDDSAERHVVAAGHGGDRRLILVVEDDREVRDATLSILQGLGYGTLAAADGPAALAHLDGREAIDLLLIDVVLPGGMSGFDLTREVRERWPRIKVLLMSGYPIGASRGNDQARMPPLLRKPFLRADLARMISQTLEAPELEARN